MPFMPKPTRIIIYVRFSPRPGLPAGELDSNEKQIEQLTAYAYEQGWGNIETRIFQEAETSGHDWNRPTLWDAIRAVKDGAIFLARDLERVARDSTILALVQHQILTRGGEIHTIEHGRVRSDDPVSRFLATVFGAVGQLQREISARRSRTAARTLLKNGRFRGHTTPFGWAWKDPDAFARAMSLPKTDPGRKAAVSAANHVVEVPEQQETIDVIRRLDEDGCSWEEIATRLNRDRLPWKDGEQWTLWRVRAVVERWKEKRPKRQRMPRL
jgi:DNA invertase Pin-like site-specific DNA recombinase